MVGENFAFEMVALVLHYACEKTRNFFFVGLHVFVEPAQVYMFYARHVLAHAGQTEAAFGTAHFLAIENFYFGIHKHELAAGTLRKSFGHRVGINHDQTYALAYLRSCKAYTFRLIHCGEHVFYKVFESGKILRQFFCLPAEHRMTVEIYWKFH